VRTNGMYVKSGVVQSFENDKF